MGAAGRDGAVADAERRSDAGAHGGPPLQVGLTGNIGSGKSSVAALLAERHGAVVIDADVLARQATSDADVLARIAERVRGDLVSLTPEGRPQLDRAATAALVFADAEALQRLNAIVHPWVRRRAAEWVAAYTGLDDPPPVIVHDIPLLYENDLDRGLEAVIVVSAPLDTRVARVVARSGLGAKEVRRRDAAQLPLEQKIARADFVVDNAGDLQDLEARVALLWEQLLELRSRRD